MDRRKRKNAQAIGKKPNVKMDPLSIIYLITSITILGILIIYAAFFLNRKQLTFTEEVIEEIRTRTRDGDRLVQVKYVIKRTYSNGRIKYRREIVSIY